MFITADGVKLWVETAGPEDAASTVLLLHGFPYESGQIHTSCGSPRYEQAHAMYV